MTPGGDQDRAGGGYLVQVVEHLDLKLSLFEDVALAGQILGFGRLGGGVGIQGFVPVGGGIADFIDVLERVQRPSGEILAAVLGNAGQGVHIRPVFGPVGAQRNERAVGDRTVFGLIVLNILSRSGVMAVGLHLLGDVDHAQGEHRVLHTESIGERSAFDKVAGEVDVCAELARELKCLDLAFEHRIAPVEYHLAELHGALGDTAPVRAVVIERVGKLHPFEFFGLGQRVPEFIHE